MPKGNAPRGKKTVLYAQKMPDGSQIYARGKSTADKMYGLLNTVDNLRLAEKSAWRDVENATGDKKKHNAALTRWKKVANASLGVSKGVGQLGINEELKGKPKRPVKK